MENTEPVQSPESLVPSESKEESSLNAKDEVASLADRLSLHSIPSIDRSDGSASPDAIIPTVPNLAHTPPNSPKTPILAHTPPPQPAPSDPIPRPPSTSSSAKPSLDALGSSQSQSDPPSPGLSSQNSGQDDSRGTDDPPPPAPAPPSSDSALHAAYGSSPPSISGLYSGIGGLYSSSHPSSGIYSGSASLGSIYGSAGPPPVPPPPLDEGGGAIGGFRHRREHSLNSIHSIHSVNSFKEFYDKSTLNQFISTSPKLSNREMEMNRMSGLYGSIASTADYSGLTEMFTDPVEEEVRS
ncbi:hypothetical protein Pcinc_034118 [Petrolisthes cinctipes]|uniref:Uncharacterized protein n=1 Tax=Petrolisthes cinctipes TaxID=88211 RepID=A0AAE1EQU5_PETCI|nr:hypothetical protein Pcinc_034118 [Petrolisthes cinctipes]